MSNIHKAQRTGFVAVRHTSDNATKDSRRMYVCMASYVLACHLGLQGTLYLFEISTVEPSSWSQVMNSTVRVPRMRVPFTPIPLLHSIYHHTATQPSAVLNHPSIAIPYSCGITGGCRHAWCGCVHLRKEEIVRNCPAQTSRAIKYPSSRGPATAILGCW